MQALVGGKLFFPFIFLFAATLDGFAEVGQGIFGNVEFGLIYRPAQVFFGQFQFFFAVLFPLIFLCGTYFPLSRLPFAMQCALWVIPLTSVVDIIRAE